MNTTYDNKLDLLHSLYNIEKKADFMKKFDSVYRKWIYPSSKPMKHFFHTYRFLRDREKILVMMRQDKYQTTIAIQFLN